ncbi:hypothetical protein B7463_g10923, partial [Scytalidium lignicola]
MASFIGPQALPQMIPSEQIIPTTKTILAEVRDVRNAVVKNATPSTACFANVIKPLIDIENRIQGRLGLIVMLRYASLDKATREASNEVVRLMGESESEFTAREDFYMLVKAVENKHDELDSEATKYLNCLLIDFMRCGHGVLDKDGVKHYLEKRNEIDKLRRKFNENIRDEDGGVWLSLEELDGVPGKDLSQFLEKEGMKFVHFRKTELDIIMKYARNPATRKKMYVADANKLVQNVDLFKEVLIQRDENARLLGYRSHAAFRLEKRVAKSSDWVENFLDNLEAVLIPQGNLEMQELLGIKQRYLAENVDYPQEYPNTMPPWDYAYYTRLSLQDIQVDHAKISEYFPLQNTVLAMLEVFTSCLQLRFVPLSPELITGSRWHEDVEAWSVWDERESSKGEFIGYLYTDLLWRPNKHQGSQNVNIQCGYLKDDGTRTYPATVLMCSFPRPPTLGYTLLKHNEIVSLFHELGHGIHDLLSRTSYVKYHGHRAPPDFAETPSIMLENWCWMRDELKQMSCHYTTLDSKYLNKWQEEHPGENCPPATIPDDIIDNLIRNRNLNRTLWFLYQLALSRFDMSVHNARNHAECVNLDPTGLYNDLMEKLRFLSNPDPRDRGHPHADFGHLLSGYDAGYYSYLSASVFATDIFQATFAENSRSLPAWDKYRRGILEYGGSRDEMEMMTKFLGRPPSAESLLRSLKLSG